MESTETSTSLESSLKSCSISTATDRDLEILGQMGHVFAQLYGKNIMAFDTQVFLAKMRQYQTELSGIILCSHENWELTGAIAGLRYENVFDGAPCATELFWY